MKKFILFTSFFGFLLTPISFAWAKQNVLQDLTYLQRAGTKLVDLNYRLTLETGQTAEVTFTFSHDNGSTFPVACRSITGDAGKGLTSGYKSAVWDAGVDWPLQFTDLGRIKATCLVTGEDPPPDDDRKPLAFEVVSVPIKSSKIIYSPAWSLNKWIDEAIEMGEMTKRPKGYKVAKYEVTNHQWNEVAEWSVSRGYDLKQVSYSPGEENLPRTNVAIKEVVKWLNALSEKQGLTPMYYLDAREPRRDINGDGKYSLGGGDSWWGGEEEGDWDYQWDPDFDWTLIPNGRGNLSYQIDFDPNGNGMWDEGEPFYDRNRNKIYDDEDSWQGFEEGDGNYQWAPNFDWTLIPNGKKNLYRGGDIQFDPNFNGLWDEGEPFYDRNRNGKFDSKEFEDLNKNGQVDDGLTKVYRTGDISSIVKDSGEFLLCLHTKISSSGFVLPEVFVVSDVLWSESHYLSMGGRENEKWSEYQEEQWWFSYGDLFTIKEGMIYKDEWPWGAESPDAMPNIDEYAITPFGKFSSPQGVGLTKANDYGIYDMIGNVSEYNNHWFEERGYELVDTIWRYYRGHNAAVACEYSVGGSVSYGFEKVNNWDPHDMELSKVFPSNTMGMMIEGAMPDPWLPEYDGPYDIFNGHKEVGFRPLLREF